MAFDLALPLILTFSIGSLFVAGFLTSWVLKKDTGTAPMRAISDAIKEGAEAFLRRQNTTIGPARRRPRGRDLPALRFVRDHHDFDPVPTAMHLAFWTTLSFVLGAPARRSPATSACGSRSAPTSARPRPRRDVPQRRAADRAARRRGVAASPSSRCACSASAASSSSSATSREVPRLRARPAADRRLRLRRLASSPSSPSSAAASTPRRPTSAPTSSARSRPASRRTTRATRRSSPTSSATTSATAPAAAPTSSSPRPPRTSAP